MQSEKIIASWGKVKANEAAHERMLNNILARNSAKKNKIAQWLIFAPIAACLVVVLIIFLPFSQVADTHPTPIIPYPAPIHPPPTQEDLTLDDARSCQYFGEFIPHVPAEFNLNRIWRAIAEDANTIFAFWYNERSSITWQVSMATEFDLTHVVYVNDRKKFDLAMYQIPWFESVPQEIMHYIMNPVFRAEEITLEAVEARAIESRDGGIQMNFGVLYGDILVTVNISGQLTPQEVWEIILQI